MELPNSFFPVRSLFHSRCQRGTLQFKKLRHVCIFPSRSLLLFFASHRCSRLASSKSKRPSTSSPLNGILTRLPRKKRTGPTLSSRTSKGLTVPSPTLFPAKIGKSLGIQTALKASVWALPFPPGLFPASKARYQRFLHTNNQHILDRNDFLC